MKRNLILFLMAFLVVTACTKPTTNANKTTDYDWKQLTQVPPMGWNSYDAYHQYITEAQFKQCVDSLAKKMLPFGYEYAVIDFRWYIKDFNQNTRDQSRDAYIDKYGRAIPSPERYPSAANGKGFKPIADYVHSKEMKFGIHIMRGIPRTALKQNTPILGTTKFAADIAEPFDSCDNWNDDMWGVDYTEAGQAYYNSIFNLYAAWGVDFVKADDMMVPVYNKKEIEMMRKAIDQCGRPMVLSLSCGEAQLSFAKHLEENANMYRISIDIWDKWSDVKRLIELAHYWSPFIGDGTWPDADMVPIGILKLNDDDFIGTKGRKTRLTTDEQYTMLNIWAMMRSPIMWGGDPITSSQEDYAMMTNKEWINVIKNSRNNRQIYHGYGRGQKYNVWFADIEGSNDKYFALFNISDEASIATFSFESEYLRDANYEVYNIWSKQCEGKFAKAFSVNLPAHGSGLYRLSKVR